MKILSRTSICCLMWCLLAVVLPGSVGGEAPQNADQALEQLAWIVGGKWVTEVKVPDGNPLVVESTFDWGGHRKTIKYAIVFKRDDQTTTQYEGTYWWNPEKKQLALLQIDRSGNVTESTVTLENKTFKQANTVTLADGMKREQRVEFTRDGDDKFRFKAFVKRDNEWTEAVAFEYHRVRDAK